MLYCPRCKNTHWTVNKDQPALAFLLFKKSYRCQKCDKAVLGSIFKSVDIPPTPVTCPSCGQLARRSRRNWIERLALFVRAYRCPKCHDRFLKLRLSLRKS